MSSASGSGDGPTYIDFADPDAEIEISDLGSDESINHYLDDFLSKIFPELEGLPPKLLGKNQANISTKTQIITKTKKKRRSLFKIFVARVREKIDQSQNGTGQANITEIFDILKRKLTHKVIYLLN